MTRLLLRRIGIASLATPFFLLTMAGAQQKTHNGQQSSLSYDLGREVSIQGSVIIYSETSSAAPFGPHVTLQTSSGVLDVHLGNARLLESNHVTFAAGDAIRVVGENVPVGAGNPFLARIVQTGSQTITLRNPGGLPLRPATKFAGQKGAL